MRYVDLVVSVFNSNLPTGLGNGREEEVRLINGRKAHGRYVMESVMSCAATGYSSARSGNRVTLLGISSWLLYYSLY